jgi:LPXTG-site transpeptidase (sortase) family protein
MKNWLNEMKNLDVEKIGRTMIALGLFLGVVAAVSTLADVSNAMEYPAGEAASQPLAGDSPAFNTPQSQPGRAGSNNGSTANSHGQAILPNGLEEASLKAPIDLKPQSASSAIGTNAIRSGLPQRLVITAINLDAPVVEAPLKEITIGRQVFSTWDVPNQFAAGWQQTSASLGKPGNTVLNGHHNEFGEVFKRLVDLKVGDQIVIDSDTRQFVYLVTNRLILPEKGQPVSVRLNNARWILPTNDERLTLVTCYPYTNNTHRLIIVARPLATDEGITQPDLSPLSPPNGGTGS